MSTSPSSVEIQAFINRFEEHVRAGMEYNRLFADKDEYEKVRGW